MDHSIEPLLILNLTSEMLYVLNQRMVAQSIDFDKQKQVIESIIMKAFNEKFMNQLYSGQGLASNSSSEEMSNYHSRDPVKQHNRLCLLFRKFAHSSCMRLNEVSMSKLYDLMIMCLKYQIFLTRSPSEIYSITLNHLDSIERMAANPRSFFENTQSTLNYEKSEDKVCQHIRNTKQNFLEFYKNYSEKDFNFIKMALDNLLKNSLTKISMFVRADIQKSDGQFIYIQKSASSLSNIKFEMMNKNVVDCCYRGSTLGNSLYHLFGRKDDGSAGVAGQKSVDEGLESQNVNKNNSNKNNSELKSIDETKSNVNSSTNIEMINFHLGAEQMKIIKNTCLGLSVDRESEDGSDFEPDLFEDCSGLI